jgi:nucleotide-binding universal stress UspA family protein
MSVFPTKILLATDGSEDAQLAATTAWKLAAVTNSELHVLHVGPTTLIPYYPSIPEGTEPARAKREAEKVLNEQVKRLDSAGGSVAQSHLRMGGAAEEIVALGEELEAGLIVVGSRGRGGLRRALMGSVSDAVVRYAHCPVLVVRGGEDGEPIVSSKKILLATDGSEEAELASEAAVELAGAIGSELHVITVGGTYRPGAGVTVVAPSLLEATLRELERAARELLDEQVKKIKESGGTISEAHVEMGGAPDQQIVALGEEIGAGLIVMGSRGLGGMRRTLLGSVSDSVVRHAHCPVLVVRH